MILVELTLSEVMQAAFAGVVRRITSMKDGLNKNKHAEKSDWSTDIDGAGAEMAFAKLKKTYWSASNRSFKEPDVGDWQVRSTCHSDGHLIIRPNDKDPAETFALAITDLPKVWFVGWITAGAARDAAFWREDKNAWWVPQGELTGFD